MKSIFLISFLFIDVFMTYKVMSCNVNSRIDSISYLYYRGIAFVLTSNGYYYVINEDDVLNEEVKQFNISGRIPFMATCCDSAIIEDIDECDRESDNQHIIGFIKHFSSSSEYISLNISSLLTEDKRNLWLKPKSINKDVILSNVDIDYTKPIDAIFNTDNTGEVFFIQGQYYSGIEFEESCPQTRNQIIVYERRKLSELSVDDNVDSAYYEPNGDGKPILYLTNYNKNVFYKILIDSINSKEGKLVSLKTTTHPISSHPIFSRICAPNDNHNNGYNSSLLSAEDPMSVMSMNITTALRINAYLSVFMSFIFWYLIK